MPNYTARTVLAPFFCCNHENGGQTQTTKGYSSIQIKALVRKHVHRQSTAQTVQRQGSSKEEMKKDSGEFKNPELFTLFQIVQSFCILLDVLKLILSIHCK